MNNLTSSYEKRPRRFPKAAGWTILILLLAGHLVVGARLYSNASDGTSDEDAYAYMELFTKAIEQIRLQYVDEEKVTYKDLIYGAMRGMLMSLDEHSAFMEPETFSDMKDDTEGHFGGLGIVISLRDGVLTIITPMEDTPGFHAGIMSGDKVIEIEGESTEGLTLQDAVKKLRGEPGTKVNLTLLRPETQEIKKLTITRAVINVPSVKDAKILEDGIGYVRILQFNQPTGEDLRRDLETLREEGMRALVLDLRDNHGGLLRSAVDVCQLFLERGELVVYTQERDEKNKQSYLSRGRRPFLEIPMVILVNGESASASEIVAGALQDHKRAVLLGEKTFGKGSVQSVIPLPRDGSALRLTTAKYYTPSRRVIHGNGIEPDITVKINPIDWHKIRYERAQPEGLRKNLDEEGLEDIQLQRAVDVLKGILAFRRNGDAKG